VTSYKPFSSRTIEAGGLRPWELGDLEVTFHQPNLFLERAFLERTARTTSQLHFHLEMTTIVSIDFRKGLTQGTSARRI